VLDSDRDSSGKFINGHNLWKNGRQFSVEHRRKLSEARKGKAPWNKGKKGVQEAWNKGVGWVTSNCEFCGKGFRHRQCVPRRFCSLECAHKSPQRLERMSIALKGRIAPNLGIPHSSEVRKKISKNHARLSGKLNPMWRGGTTPEHLKRLSSLQWKKLTGEIMKRDDHTCQQCLSQDTPLAVHHIIPWRLTRNDSPDNLITLCNICHPVVDAILWSG